MRELKTLSFLIRNKARLPFSLPPVEGFAPHTPESTLTETRRKYRKILRTAKKRLAAEYNDRYYLYADLSSDYDRIYYAFKLWNYDRIGRKKKKVVKNSFLKDVRLLQSVLKESKDGSVATTERMV